MRKLAISTWRNFFMRNEIFKQYWKVLLQVMEVGSKYFYWRVTFIQSKLSNNGSYNSFQILLAIT